MESAFMASSHPIGGPSSLSQSATSASTTASAAASDSNTSTANTPVPTSPTPASPTMPRKANGMTAGTKRRKLPACDSCKLRRVLCCPVAPPGSCSRCMEKAIICTTTPVIRKKPTGRTGRRIEEARAMFGAADPTSADFVQPDHQPWLASTSTAMLQTAHGSSSSTRPSLSSDNPDSRLGLQVLSGELAAHLLGLYQALPQSWLPLFPRGRISVLFETAGRRLSSMPPQAEVLAHVIMALTCRLSSHPYILGDGPPSPSFEALTSQHLKEQPDLRGFGHRREAMCDKLRLQAVRLAWERGTLVDTCEESMASCHLLDVLESRADPRKGAPYTSAFVSHLRTMLDEKEGQGKGKVIHQPLGWSALIMREALACLRIGRQPNFHEADDHILAGDSPTSINDTLLDTVDDIDVRDSVMLFFRPMRPYTYHVARLARECSERVTALARTQPLDEAWVSQFLAQLDSLERLLQLLADRIAFTLSPAATSAHALPAPYEAERRYIMTACLHTLQLAWAGLTLPLHLDLKRRLVGLQEAATTAEKRRARDRLQLLLKHSEQAVTKAARMVAACIAAPPSLGFLTHLQQERIDSWVDVLLDLECVEEGGEGITREERAKDLCTILAGLKMMGWSWSDNSELVESLEARLQEMHITPPESASAATIASAGTTPSDPTQADQSITAGASDDLSAFSAYLATPSPPPGPSAISTFGTTDGTPGPSMTSFGPGADALMSGLFPSATTADLAALQSQFFGGNLLAARSLASSFGFDLDSMMSMSSYGMGVPAAAAGPAASAASTGDPPSFVGSMNPSVSAAGGGAGSVDTWMNMQ